MSDCRSVSPSCESDGVGMVITTVTSEVPYRFRNVRRSPASSGLGGGALSSRCFRVQFGRAAAAAAAASDFGRSVRSRTRELKRFAKVAAPESQWLSRRPGDECDFGPPESNTTWHPPPSAALGDELLPRHPTLTTLTMADLTAYLVLAVALVPPLLRQSQRLFGSARSASHAPPPPPPPPSSSRFASKARLAPFATPFSAAVTITTLGLVLISLANLVPVQYGVDIFIPVQAVHNLRRSIFTLNTAPSGRIHARPLPRLQRAHHHPHHHPPQPHRRSAPSLLPIGFHTLPKQQELQALIARLSSYEARRIYLLLGPKPLLDCTFCTKPNDFFWYGPPFPLGRLRLAHLGSRAHHSSSGRLDRRRHSPGSRPLLAQTSGAALKIRRRGPQQVAHPPPSRSSSLSCRSRSSSCSSSAKSLPDRLASTTGIPTCISYASLPFSPSSSSSTFSPHHACPTASSRPCNTWTPTQQNLQSILHLNEIIDATRAVVLDDQTLLRRATTERKHSSTDSAAQLIRAVQAQGGDAASDTLAQAQNSIRSVTLQWWRTAEQLNRQLDRGSPSASSSNSAPAHTAAASDPSSNPSAHGTNP
ncbi:hypothetical protein L1887_56822 [Cichorium endivia]|nr:hypothetical protein L1887_56822 [Cichorium endivia]